MTRRTRQSDSPFLVGCHLSIAGGLSAAVDRADRLSTTALQIFTHSPSTWRMPPISSEDVEMYKRALIESSVAWVAVHAMYLINLATPDLAHGQRSTAALITEAQRAAWLGADLLVVHMGYSMGSPPDEALRRTVDALRRVLDDDAFRPPSRLRLALENTAGAGSSVGGTWERLAQVLAGLENDSRVGLCLDTCHAVAAGYALHSQSAVEKTLRSLERTIDRDRLMLIHLNDSASPVGSRRDRHAHIGGGTIGEKGVSAILTHPTLRGVPVILETPKTTDTGEDADPINLEKVRALRRAETATASG
jgi:deoxyribonuclease IV